MTISKGRFFIIIAAAFVAGIVFTLAGMIGLSSKLTTDSAKVDDKKLAQIQAYIDRYYLNDYDKEDLVNYAYRGYVAGLDDPYSTYMTKEEYDSFETSSKGSYSGIGVTFEKDSDGRYVIVRVAEDSPAEKAGLKEGDFMTKVDGQVYADTDVMAAKIRGKKGTEVKLTYVRDDEEKTVTIVRDKIVQKSVDYKMLDDNIGYIEITEFIDTTGDDFSKALDAVQEQGAKKLVLDLRDNGGGLVDDAVSVADHFLDAGVACYVQDKNGKTEEYKVEDGKTDLETVVLVNENSASASEILAGALQDNGYKIVGTKTFGKGVIQTTFNMKDGDALKLTILEYLTPDKHKVHKKGIKPNVKVKDDKDTKNDEQLDKAEDLLEN